MKKDVFLANVKNEYVDMLKLAFIKLKNFYEVLNIFSLSCSPLFTYKKCYLSIICRNNI